MWSHIFSIGFFLVALASAQVRPPNYSPDAIPETSFTCEDKITGGYYADQEADCQLFHVCVQVSEYEFQDFRFLCPNDTVFDQQNLVCTNWFEVDCHQSVSFFFQGVGVKTNKGQSNRVTPRPPEEPEEYDYNYEYTYFYEDDFNDDSNRFLGDSTPSPASGNGGAGGQRGQSFQTVNNNIEQERPRPPPPLLQHTTTAIPISVTTTRRPPRVKSNQNKNKRPTVRPEVPIEFSQVDIQDDRSKDPFRNPPLISADGKKPRVKSNLFRNGAKKSPAKKDFSKAGQKVEFNEERFRFVTPEEVVDYETDIGTFEQTLSNGPEVKPDGKRPRVKSNIEAIRNNQGRKTVVTTEASPFIPTSRPLEPAPTVEPVNEFVFSQRPPGSRPRVKSNLNTGRRVVPQNELPFPLSRTPTTFAPETTRSPVQFSTQRPSFNINNRPFITNDELPVTNTQRPFTNTLRPVSNRPFSNDQRPVSNTQRPFVSTPQQSFSTQRPFISSPRTPTRRPFVSTTQRPQISSTLLPVFDYDTNEEPEYIDEIDEFVATTFRPRARPTRPVTSNPVTTPRSRPRVKSNLLVNRKNKFSRKQKRPEKSRNRLNFNNNEVNFVSNAIGNEVQDPCSNPFKCPPTKIADGRKPRVKSNIKARRRNYFHPSASKTNRIRGRKSFNDRRKATRQGKSQRNRPFEKVAPQNELFNSFDYEEEVTEAPIIQTTTESLLQTLLHQMREEAKSSQSSTTERIIDNGFAFTQRPPGSRPRVKSNLNRRPQITSTTERPFVSSTQRPLVSSTERPFVSSTQRPQLFENNGFEFTQRPPGSKPRVKANLSRRPQITSTQRPFVSSTQAPQTTNENSGFDFTQRPPGSQPRVKSNLSRNRSPLQAFLKKIEEEKQKQPGVEPLVFSRARRPVQRPITPPQKIEPAISQTSTSPPPPAIHFTTSEKPFSIIGSTAAIFSSTTTQRPFSSPSRPPVPSIKPNQRPLSTTRKPKALISTTPEYEYEYYYEYEDYEETDPPPLTTTDVPVSTGASLITQIPIVSSPIPASDQAPITLPPRTTVGDPKLPPIPTFSPKDLRKQRIQGHKILLQAKQNSFPSFPKVPPQTRFPPRGRPEPIIEETTTPETTTSTTTQRSNVPLSSDGRRPRVKSNLRLAKKNNFKSKFNKSDFTRRFLRNRSRFGKNNLNEVKEDETTTTEKEVTTTTTENSRLSFADIFTEAEVKPDGRKPRVKSNIKQRLADNGRPFTQSHKIPVPSDLFEPKNVDKRKIDNDEISINEVKQNKTNAKDILAQLSQVDPFKINQSSGDHEPVVRPDGQKPRVKSNILLASANLQSSVPLKKNQIFRHSKKVESAEFVFEPTTLQPLEETTTEKSEEETTTQVPTVTSTPPTSLLDVFLSTQVLNTRAVDPTLASLHEKMKEEFINNQQQTNRRKRKSKKKDLSDQEIV